MNPNQAPLPPEQDQPQHNRLAAVGAAVLAAGSLVGIGHEANTPVAVEKDVSHEAAIQVETVSTQIDSDVLNDWARTFETNPEDSESSLEQVDSFIDQHMDVFGHPKRISGIRITGLASAEGDMPGADLDQTNPKNIDLAAQRAQLAQKALVERLKQRFGYDATEKISTNPIEDQLTPEEISKVDALAGKYRFSDHTEMIKLYNRGKLSKNIEVTELLDSLLRSRRGATIEVDSTHQEATTNPGWYIGERVSADDEPVPPVANPTEGYIPETSAPFEPELSSRKDAIYKVRRANPSQIRGHQNGHHHKQPTELNQGGLGNRYGRGSHR